MYKSQGRQESIFFFFLNEAHVTMIKHREVGVLRFFFVFFFPFVWSGGGVCVCFFFFFGWSKNGFDSASWSIIFHFQTQALTYLELSAICFLTNQICAYIYKFYLLISSMPFVLWRVHVLFFFFSFFSLSDKEAMVQMDRITS